ncbi:MAG TPA: hypothetical protein VF816_03580 [Rhodocyclaceae bacterium]
MSDDPSAKERHILKTLRIVLGNIVRDTAPRPGSASPLRPETTESVRELFALIAEREAELARQAGLDVTERPYYADDERNIAEVALPTRGRDKKRLN